VIADCGREVASATRAIDTAKLDASAGVDRMLHDAGDPRARMSSHVATASAIGGDMCEVVKARLAQLVAGVRHARPVSVAEAIDPPRARRHRIERSVLRMRSRDPGEA